MADAEQIEGLALSIGTLQEPGIIPRGMISGGAKNAIYAPSGQQSHCPGIVDIMTSQMGLTLMAEIRNYRPAQEEAPAFLAVYKRLK